MKCVIHFFQGGFMYRKVALIALLAAFANIDSAEAAPRFRRKNYTTNNVVQSNNNEKVYSYTSNGDERVYSNTSNVGGNNDQDRCQAEANHMAANNITGHVFGVIGRFEGVGYGSSPNCNTCTPSSNMNLTGDASAQGRNGTWYRVRSWR